MDETLYKFVRIADKLRDMIKASTYTELLLGAEDLYDYVLTIDSEVAKTHLDPNRGFMVSGIWGDDAQHRRIQFFNKRVKALAMISSALAIYYACDGFEHAATKLYSLLIDANSKWKRGEVLKKYGKARVAFDHIGKDSMHIPHEARAIQQKLSLMYHDLLDLIKINDLCSPSEWWESHYPSINMYLDAKAISSDYLNTTPYKGENHEKCN